jgi:hypothetical protein
MLQRNTSTGFALSLDVSFEGGVEQEGRFEFCGQEAEMNEGDLEAV